MNKKKMHNVEGRKSNTYVQRDLMQSNIQQPVRRKCDTTIYNIISKKKKKLHSGFLLSGFPLPPSYTIHILL